MDPDNGHSHPHLPLPSPNDPANDPTGPPDVHYAAPRPYRHDHASMDYTFTQHPQLSHAAAYPDAHMATESHYHPLPQHQQEPPYGNHVAAESIHGTRLNLPEQGSHASRELMPNMPTQQHERLSETFTDHLPPHPMFAPPSRVIHLPPCTVVGYSPSPHHAPYDAHLVNGMAHNYNPIHAVGHGHPFSHDGARPASAEHSNASIPSAHPMSSQNHRYDLSTSASPPSGSQVQSVRSSSYTPPAHPAGVSSIPMSKDSAWKNTSLSTALECKPSQPKRPATQEPPQSQSRAVSETDSHSAASPERTPPPKNSRSGTTQPTTKPKKVKKPKMHPCTVCQKTFPRPSGLQTHMNTHYNLKREALSFPIHV
ncbi:hypothetical protein AX16_004405 [Volvariella volvacea WC 439]|nr:hypothetical protein AX16_004405 [Volvariella volvacea WC 439]